VVRGRCDLIAGAKPAPMAEIENTVNEAAGIEVEGRRPIQHEDLLRAMKDNPQALCEAKIQGMKARIGFV